MYVATHFVATTYSYIWDIYMDWGLMRCFEPGKWGLRGKFNYSPNFYYFSIFMDFILRYIWIVGMYTFGDPKSTFNDFQTVTIFLIVCEAFRRALWSLIRVENEQNSNLEAYRTIPYIPPLLDEDNNEWEA